MTSFSADGHRDPGPRLAGDYDALADLFLGGAEPRPVPAPPPAPQAFPAPALRLVAEEPRSETTNAARAGAEPAHLEAILLGSLPVYASGWIMQFVRVEAERLNSPVALVRSLAGEGSVDIVGAGANSMGLARLDSMPAAIAQSAQRCGRVIVRTGETSEADLAAHESVRSVTLLTGVDEPALIAAYRTLKSLAPRWSVLPNPPAVRIAAMGANAEQGRRAFEKIARAARVFLETPLAYAGHVERIEPTNSACVFRGPTASTIDDVLRHARETETETESPSTITASPTPDAHAEPAPRDTTVSEPLDAAEVERVNPATATLSSRIAGLATIPIAIPRCEGVELAADARGGLHLLAADDSSARPTSTLLSAQAWALLNRDLLAAACSTILGRAVESGTKATLHLFTDQPKRVRGLLDADIRVHFLAAVEMNGERAWCVAELN